jgi:hypothetical protein
MRIETKMPDGSIVITDDGTGPPERSIYPRELLGRLTQAEVVAAIRSDDDAVIFAVANLQTTVSPVLLDAPETQLLIGSLVQAGILTPERMAEVLA